MWGKGVLLRGGNTRTTRNVVRITLLHIIQGLRDAKITHNRILCTSALHWLCGRCNNYRQRIHVNNLMEAECSSFSATSTTVCRNLHSREEEKWVSSYPKTASVLRIHHDERLCILRGIAR